MINRQEFMQELQLRKHIREAIKVVHLRRGTRESDMVVGGFARRHLAALNESQLDRFEALLELNDPELLSWVLDLAPVPAAHDHDVMDLLKDFKKTISTN